MIQFEENYLSDASFNYQESYKDYETTIKNIENAKEAKQLEYK